MGGWLHRHFFILWLYPPDEVKMLPGEIDMTDSQVKALLYDEVTVEMDGFVINSWFVDATSEKNIELVWQNPLREVDLIANGMTTSELKSRLEMEISAWDNVENEKSEG